MELRNCKKHGLTEFVVKNSKQLRCGKCRKEFIKKRNLGIRNKLLETFGGKCKICGYNRCQTALEFHHINPGPDDTGVTAKSSYEAALEEAKKCLLVCANCHKEIHAGLIK